MAVSYRQIYDTVKRIPPGKVASYGQIAALLGIRGGGRVVGFAMAACRDGSVPCHRVVDRLGGTKAAFDVYGRGVQRALLESEGVLFTADGSVDMARCQWETPETLPGFTA